MIRDAVPARRYPERPGMQDARFRGMTVQC
jgi:hypothetical protein